MNFAETCKMAFKNLMSSKARSFLTMLGIIIGVASVVVIMGIGAANMEKSREEFRKYGLENITLEIKGRGRAKEIFGYEALKEIVRKYPEYMVYVSPDVSLYSELHNGTKKMDYSNIKGISGDYFKMSNLTLEQGRSLYYVDEWKREAVCVIGSYVNNVLYQGRGLGETLKINGNSYEVVGVLKESDPLNGEYGVDNTVLMPYTTASRMGGSGSDNYMIAAKSQDVSEKAVGILKQELQDFFRDTKAYRVTTNADMLQMFSDGEKRQMMSMALTAGISLVVGGIGIMNIMLVSVTERTREIGIRKALGAKRKFILRQFMIESAVTSGMGGIIGVLVSYPVCYIAREFTLRSTGEILNITPDIHSILVSVAISVGVGIFFGFMPARKAAMLNPIDALRHN